MLFPAAVLSALPAATGSLDLALQHGCLLLADLVCRACHCLQDHQCIGHVRGLGLFVGIEMVIDQQSQLPAPGTAKWVKEGLKARKVLVSTDGHHNTVIKLKPPMCFDKGNADTLVQQLQELLQAGIPQAVQDSNGRYNPQDKGTRVQNTSWQELHVNGNTVPE